MMLVWGFIILLTLAVIFLIWLQFNNNVDVPNVHGVPVEDKVAHLEENLKKTLEIMQDLAKKMHVQQEVLDQTTVKLQQVELQNAELVNLLAQVVEPKK
jgi:beta-lactam-binding protein with PASTA domain